MKNQSDLSVVYVIIKAIIEKVQINMYLENIRMKTLNFSEQAVKNVNSMSLITNLTRKYLQTTELEVKMQKENSNVISVIIQQISNNLIQITAKVYMRKYLDLCVAYAITKTFSRQI